MVYKGLGCTEDGHVPHTDYVYLKLYLKAIR